MTVSYFGHRADGPPSKFNSLSWCSSVVFRWRGSVFKYVFREMVLVTALWYCVGFAIAHVCVRPDSHMAGGDDELCTDTHADNMIEYLRKYQSTLRTLLSFMLVFYYQQIYDRAKSIFWAIPWPDECFFMAHSMVGAHAHDTLKTRDGTAASNDPERAARGKLLRATVFRYILATVFMVCHSISVKFARLYPQPFECLVRLGLLTSQEIHQIELRHEKLPYLSELYFVSHTAHRTCPPPFPSVCLLPTRRSAGETAGETACGGRSRWSGRS
jgi:hypothetical protein